MTYYHGTLRISNPKTLQSWIDKGWFKNEIQKGYIFAVFCGRFKKEICNCSKCRKQYGKKDLIEILKINKI